MAKDTPIPASSGFASTGKAEPRATMDLACYVKPGWRPRLRAAPARRAWMDATPQAYAYRCLPLNIANAHGWEILSPCGFEAEWNGGDTVGDLTVRTDPGARPAQVPVSLFGQGILTFHVEGVMRTPPGVDLWVGGSPNRFKDGISPLAAVIETDWSPFTFTMNWRFTRPGQCVRFEENEPFCFFFPVVRGLVQAMRPRIAPIEAEADLKTRFETWSASRDALQAQVAAHPPAAPADCWQKFYYRGVDADGRPGAADHCAKLRLAEFEGAGSWPEPAAAPPTEPAQAPPPPSRDEVAPIPGKLEWLMATRRRMRALSPEGAIPTVTGIDPRAFLQAYYAAGRPVVLAGEMAGWPALERWTPDYLKRLVGAVEIEVQAGRQTDPDFERRMPEHRARMAFDAFIDAITRPGAGNDLYLTAYNSATNGAALKVLEADLGHIDKLLTREDPRPCGMPWIGPAGTFTPLHHDLTNNLLLQVRGRKRLLLAAPEETPRLYNDHHVYSRVRDLAEPGLVDRYPGLEGLQVHQVILEPGQALFIPVGWWHQVTALDFSVTFTCTNFHWPNDGHLGHPA